MRMSPLTLYVVHFSSRVSILGEVTRLYFLANSRKSEMETSAGGNWHINVFDVLEIEVNIEFDLLTRMRRKVNKSLVVVEESAGIVEIFDSKTYDERSSFR